jgi:hypothetical protein
MIEINLRFKVDTIKKFNSEGRNDRKRTVEELKLQLSALNELKSLKLSLED